MKNDMIYIIDIAKQLKDKLFDVANKIAIDLDSNKNHFGIGVTEADILRNQIGFTLETRSSDVRTDVEDYEDNGLLISADIFLDLSVENQSNINISLTLFRSTGQILDDKDFVINQYENDKIAIEIITECLQYLDKLSKILKNLLLEECL